MLDSLHRSLESAKSSGEQQQGFVVAPDTMAEFLSTHEGLFPAGTNVSSLAMSVSDGNLNVNGQFTINRLGMEVPVNLRNVTLRPNEQGIMEVIGTPDYDITVTPLLQKRARRMADGVIADIDNKLRSTLTARTPGWGVNRFSLDGGQIGVQFSNKQK